MKQVTLNYIPGLGDFLDENNISWIDNGNDTITVSFHNDEDIFRTGWNFGKFYSTL